MILFVAYLFLKTQKLAIPIKKYKNVQTGPNIHPGGEKLGFFKSKYHVPTDNSVKKDPIIPGKKAINTKIIKIPKFFINLIIILLKNNPNSLLCIYL